MRQARFAPLDRDLSRVALGSAWFKSMRFDEVATTLETWVELGGNVIDTAQNYGKGASESAIGRWLTESGRRDDVVIITKGGHPYEGRSRLTANDLTADLDGSFERLGVDAIDLWMLHRDEASLPVGEILDTVARVTDGRTIRSIGASNWTTDRLAEADAYARSHGVRGFGASSPNLALARQIAEPWPGCVSASDPDSRHWYETTQLPLFAWSAAAAGYFAGRAENPDPIRTDSVAATYDSPENRERRRRAEEIAARLDVTATQVAVAWVLNQPFPTFAVVGPDRLEELRQSAAAADLELTPDDVSWLALDEPR
jgi:aryl-alcohol dehydrogenase-like predicted oxidoreductase